MTIRSRIFRFKLLFTYRFSDMDVKLPKGMQYWSREKLRKVCKILLKGFIQECIKENDSKRRQVYKAYIDKMCEIPLVPTLVVELFSYFAISLREHHFDNMQVHMLASIMESVTIACVFGITESEDVVTHANKIFEIMGYNPKNIMIMTCNAVYVTLFGTQFRQIPLHQRLVIWNFLRRQNVTVHILHRNEKLVSRVQETIYAVEDEICNAVHNHTVPGEVEAMVAILYILCRSHQEDVSFHLQRAVEYRTILLRIQANSREFHMTANALLQIINRYTHEPPPVYVNSLSLSRHGSGNLGHLTLSGPVTPEPEHGSSRRHSSFTSDSSPSVRTLRADSFRKSSPIIRTNLSLKRNNNTFPSQPRKGSVVNTRPQNVRCSFEAWDSD